MPDPYRQYASPYLAMGNNPVNKVDPDGGCDEPPCAPIFGGADVILGNSDGCNCSYVTDAGVRVTNIADVSIFSDMSVGDLFGSSIQLNMAGNGDIFGPIVVNPEDRLAREWLMVYVNAVSIVAQPMIPRVPSARSFNYTPRGQNLPVGTKNAGLAGGTHPKTGVPFNSQGFPNFKNHLYNGGGKNDVIINPQRTRADDFAEANRLAGFSSTPKGYTWHHHQQYGRMQLVNQRVHSQTGHSGGWSIWGGGSRGSGVFR